MKEDVKEKYKKEIMYIKNYISLNPGKPKFLVSANTHISLEIINKLVNEGIILEEAGILKLVTRQTIKGEERKELLIRLKQSVIEDKDKDEDKDEDKNKCKNQNRERSKLLEDLRRIQNDQEER